MSEADVRAFLDATTATHAHRGRIRARLFDVPRRGARIGLVAAGWSLSMVAAAAVGWISAVERAEPLVLSLDDGRVTLGAEAGVVRSPEAELRGAGFVAERGAHATRVVAGGTPVDVACRDGSRVTLAPGEAHQCLPPDLATLLVRAAELGRDHAPPEARLSTVAAGLALAPEGNPARGELLAHRVAALRDAGRDADAVAEAEQYLEQFSARRAEFAPFVAHARFAERGCDAVNALERAAEAAPSDPASLLLASCVVDADPERARALLAAVPPAEGWEAFRTAVAARGVGR